MQLGVNSRKKLHEMTPHEFHRHTLENPHLKGLDHGNIVKQAVRNRQKIPNHVLDHYPHYKKVHNLIHNGGGNGIAKAKKAPVGTRRKRKTGVWIKDKPGHWKMLREHVKVQHSKDEVHPNHSHAKLMQQAAAKIVRHVGKSEGRYSRSIGDKILDNEFKGKHDIGRFGLWKKRVLDAVEKYFKDMSSVYGGESVRNPSNTAQRIKAWREALANSSLELHSQAERDSWVSEQFASRGKKVAHIMYAAREFIGRDTHLSVVPDTGFKGLCKAIITKLYEHGPDGLDKKQIATWEKAFKTVFDRKEGVVVPLAKALGMHGTKAFYKNNPKWFFYCCTRYAMKNDGHVDMSMIESYMKNAMRYHGSKNPPSPTYDQEDETMLAKIRLGLTPAKKKLVKKPTQTVKKLYLKKKRSGK